ncbi:Queuosine biosynthesis QueD, PTPS-I [hydrothermal vent metagenome]|uniref:Queuosine biosynthesis QueD, PTPS-I n=1 Tax=hydrothermal vent metagenome TaxID=652676 RepID=A0A1W1CLZ4_9ZZZZ
MRDYPGNCANLHGHNWQIEVSVEAEELDESGMVIDFKTIKSKTKEVISKLDHKLLNDIKPFDKINPTAENIAKYCYQQISKQINTNNIKISLITIWETPRACASYKE